MADFKTSFNIMKKLEFSSSANVLHKNPTESEVTYFGIYEKANPNFKGWEIIHEVIAAHGGSLSAAGKYLITDKYLTSLVEEFYLLNYWQKMRLDEVLHQKIADEMFCFGVNAGNRAAVRLAQKVINNIRFIKIAEDGLIGPATIGALNNIPVELFDEEYDAAEIEYYDKLIENNPKLAVYSKGWRNRAFAV